MPYTEGRGKNFCRGCLGKDLFSALDFGSVPLANELLLDPKETVETFPLHMRICSSCGLGQVMDVTTPERIFKDYRYLSSISSTFLAHAESFVDSQIESGSLRDDDWILEIASNDGYLLKKFLERGLKVVGIEPAANVAAISTGLGIETICEFFSSELASVIFGERGYPKLIIANNVLAHVPDLKDFLTGLAVLCGPETKISIENPRLSNILIDMQFDTIYHEHYSYLSGRSVQKLSLLNGLQLIEIEHLKTHGGSNRYWLKRMSDKNKVHISVSEALQSETDLELFDPARWKSYASLVDGITQSFLAWLEKSKIEGARVFGYGAAAKASTLLNSAQVTEGAILAIADASPEKQGRYLPPHAIQIISKEELICSEPTDVVIFPWNIIDEITDSLVPFLPPGTKLWRAIPFLEQVV
jgi:hypothetical protein